MTSLRLRLTLTNLAVILVGMGIAAPLAWLTVEGLYLDTQRANLLAQAQLVARSLETAPELQPPADPYSQAANVQPGIHTRVVEGPAPVATAVSPAPYSQVANAMPGVHSRIIEERGAAVIDVQSPVPVEQKAVSPLLQYLPTPLLTPDQVELLRADNVVSGAAKTEGRTLQGLGIEPEPIEAIVPSYLWRFRKTGQFRNRTA